jgi:hypothetical protein
MNMDAKVHRLNYCKISQPCCIKIEQSYDMVNNGLTLYTPFTPLGSAK